MFTLRKSDERGRGQHGWLDSRHTFSFAHYYDPRFVGCRDLRVINEDRVVPGAGFGTHGHENMEIISYVIEGALEHKDSLGTGSIIRPGEIQRMSAGTGIRHSEFNASKTEPVHFLQIWIKPRDAEIAPSYQQITMPKVHGGAQLDLIGTNDGRDRTVLIHQDVNLHRLTMQKGATLSLPLRIERAVWLQVIKGALTLGAIQLGAGDGLSAVDERGLEIVALDSTEALIFDLR